MNVIARLVFELPYYNVKVHQISHYAIGIPRNTNKSLWNLRRLAAITNSFRWKIFVKNKKLISILFNYFLCGNFSFCITTYSSRYFNGIEESQHLRRAHVEERIHSREHIFEESTHWEKHTFEESTLRGDYTFKRAHISEEHTLGRAHIWGEPTLIRAHILGEHT